MEECEGEREIGSEKKGLGQLMISLWSVVAKSCGYD